MAKTKQISVDNVTDVPITATNYTRCIEVGEDPSVAGWPTTDFLLKKPTSADQARQIPSGQVYRFSLLDSPPNKYFGPGEIVGYVKAVTVGTTTFFQDEKEG